MNGKRRARTFWMVMAWVKVLALKIILRKLRWKKVWFEDNYCGKFHWSSYWIAQELCFILVLFYVFFLSQKKPPQLNSIVYFYLHFACKWPETSVLWLHWISYKQYNFCFFFCFYFIEMSTISIHDFLPFHFNKQNKTKRPIKFKYIFLTHRWIIYNEIFIFMFIEIKIQSVCWWIDFEPHRKFKFLLPHISVIKINSASSTMCRWKQKKKKLKKWIRIQIKCQIKINFIWFNKISVLAFFVYFFFVLFRSSSMTWNWF